MIKAAHFSSRLVLIQPKLKPVMERISGAKARGDIAEMQIAGKDMQKLYSSAGISPLGGMIGPVTQLPVAIGMFLALKKMCELPVPQMAYSGMEFLPDLTAVDPTGILAPIFAVSMFWQMTVRVSYFSSLYYAQLLDRLLLVIWTLKVNQEWPML